MRKIKLIIFDAGDVLYKSVAKEIILGEFRRFVFSYGYNLPENLEEIWNEVHWSGIVGNLNFKECNEKLFERVGVDKRMIHSWLEFYENLWKKHAKREKYVNEVLIKLKKIGYKLAILSNSITSEHEKERFLQLSGIEYKLFDKIFTSHDIGYAKPDKHSYLIVLEYFNHQPYETVFVGHDEEEITSAKNLGILTVSVKKHCSKSDYIIKNLIELPKYILLLEESL